MPRIYSANEEHNYNQGKATFVEGVAAVASGTDVSYFEENDSYSVDNSVHALKELDKLSRTALVALATEMGLTLPTTITKQYLTKAIYDSLATVTLKVFNAFTVTYANGNASATGNAPTETAKGIGETFKAAANTFTYTGHTFAGWKDGNNVEYDAGDTVTMGSANLTLTAQWTADE